MRLRPLRSLVGAAAGEKETDTPSVFQDHGTDFEQLQTDRAGIGLGQLRASYSSWSNLVERFFAALTEQQLRRGTHRSLPALENAIRDYLRIYNEDPHPFRWTKSADEIIESVNSVIKRINRTVH